MTALAMSRTLVQMMADLSVTCTVASIVYVVVDHLWLSIFPCKIPIKLQSFHAMLQYTYNFYHVFTNSKTCLH